MGQKVNPHGLRVGVIKNWDSRWYAKDEKFGDILVSDYNVREYLKNKLQAAGVPDLGPFCSRCIQLRYDRDQRPGSLRIPDLLQQLL